jgi:hypothetical protein
MHVKLAKVREALLALLGYLPFARASAKFISDR